MKSINLVGEPIIDLLKKIAIPASTGTLFQTLYNIVDTFFAGKISANALAAIAKSFPLYFIIIATGVGIVSASNALISNSLGAKEDRTASLYVAQSLLYSVIVSIIVTLIGLSFSDDLLRFMGSDQETIRLATDYLDIIFFATFIFLIQISLNGALNAQGDTKSYRNVLIVSFFLNIGLNPLFIFGLGPIPAFGIAGLAIATVIAQLIGLIYLAYKVHCCELKQYLSPQCFLPKLYLIKNLTNQSVPMMMNMFMIGLGIYNILFFVSKFGYLAAAGYGSALRIEQILLLPVIGLNTAVLTIAGQNFGAKLFNRVDESYTKAIIVGSSFMILAGIVIFLLADNIVSIFTDNQEAIDFGADYLKVAAFIGPVYPVFFITNALFQAIKKPIYTVMITFSRLVLLPFFTMSVVVFVLNGSFKDLFLGLFFINWTFGILVFLFSKYYMKKLFSKTVKV
tara:strand:+ start:1900 stop:3258 length:1359 start_codon:yes stop_codon:yes gene_type:complete